MDQSATPNFIAFDLRDSLELDHDFSGDTAVIDAAKDGERQRRRRNCYG